MCYNANPGGAAKVDAYLGRNQAAPTPTMEQAPKNSDPKQPNQVGSPTVGPQADRTSSLSITSGGSGASGNGLAIPQ